MYAHVLVPIAIEHNAATETALKAARLLADEGATITALNVVEAIPSYVANELPAGQAEKTAQQVLELLEQEIGNMSDITPVVVQGHAGRTIVEFAQQNGIDCIVIASHRPGLADYFLGSTAARVVRHATCSVHVVR